MKFKSSQIGIFLVAFSALALMGCADTSNTPASPVTHTESGDVAELKGEVDTSWGTDGYQDTTPLNNLNLSSSLNLRVLPSGHPIVVANDMNQSIHAFSVNGRSVLAALESAVPTCLTLFSSPCFVGSGLVQTDGKIVIGYGTLIDGKTYMARLNADGTLDTSFGNSGVADIGGSLFSPGAPGEIFQLKNGKLVTLIVDFNSPLMTMNTYLVRINTDGSVDTDYGTNGYVHASTMTFGGSFTVNPYTGDAYFTAMNMMPAVSGVITHFDSTGAQDMTFGGSGSATLTSSFSNFLNLVFDSKSNALVIAKIDLTAADGVHVAKLKLDGQLDMDFGTNGVYELAIGTSNNYMNSKIVLEESTGKILLLGNLKINGDPNSTPAVAPADQYVLTRLTADGQLDSTFGHGFGQVKGPVDANYRMTSMALTPDDRLLLAGVKADYQLHLGAPSMPCDPIVNPVCFPMPPLPNYFQESNNLALIMIK